MASTPSRIDSPSPSPTDRIVGSWYQLRECLSESNRIRTYLGHSIDDGHAVVIKIIPADAVHPGSLMRLEYESTHLQRLHSPWLASVVHVGRENGDLLLVYEHVPGVAPPDVFYITAADRGGIARRGTGDVFRTARLARTSIVAPRRAAQQRCRRQR